MDLARSSSLISLRDDGIVVSWGERIMLWLTNQALDQRTEYVQLGPDRWRATYRGFVTVSSEGGTPRDSQMHLAEAFDALLASLVRSSRPPARPAPPAAEEAPIESTAIAVVREPVRRGAASSRQQRTKQKPKRLR
jgi:hypothetical protein